MRSRAWTFTINNYTDDDMGRVGHLGTDYAEYLIVGFEIGKESTPHMQGYVYFKNARTLESMKKYLPRAHLEEAKGSPQQNYDYCSKDDDYVEYGKMPEQGRMSWDKMLNIYNDPKSKPHLYCQYRKTVEEILQRDLKQKRRTTKFYKITREDDPITAVYEYFDWDTTAKLAVVTDLRELEAYVDYDYVIYFAEYYDVKHSLWPRGVPITYFRGYETKIVDCDKFIVVTTSPDLYKLYKRII